MKKITKLISLFCLAAVFVFASCSSSTSGGGVTYIGKKAPTEPKDVGDIVFNDGSATPYAEIKARTTKSKITDAEKAAAIAVIFYVGTGLNSDVDGVPNNTTSRTLGVGLEQDNSVGRVWARTSSETEANGYFTNIETIQCTSSGSGETLTFSGDKNGSDNLEQMGTFLKLNSIDDDTNDLSNYPAFKFGKEYSTDATTGTVYDKNGWYLPSIAELYEIYKVKGTVDAATSLCGGDKFSTTGYYWSSSSLDSYDNAAYMFYFKSENNWAGGYKCNNYLLCAIREF